MRRIRLVVAYDGTNYSGWQMQKNATTIESELAGALRNLLGKEVPLIGASRTDAGVHAMGNIAVFDTDSKIPQDKFAIALNHYLPEDIRVRYSDEVTSDYHPRYEKTVKTYEYTVLNCEIALPAWRLYSYHVYRPLNIESMKAAAKLLEGEHDFSAFCSAGSQVKSKVRTVYEISIQETPLSFCAGHVLRFRVRGNGFLYNMVRIIVGTLLYVNEGKIPAAELPAILESRDRRRAGKTAPPQGLYLNRVYYAGI